MFSVCRHAIRHTCVLQRTFATAAAEKNYSIDDPIIPAPTLRPNTKGVRPSRTVHIRASSILGLSDAYAIIRGIEKSYGRIREYRFLRDAEITPAYQVILWAAFVSPESFDKVPKEGATLNIAARRPNLSQEGGQGLEDIAGLLDSCSAVEEFEGMPSFRVASPKTEGAGERTLKVTVSRADSDYRFAPEVNQVDLTKAKKLAIGHSFMQWGGFYPLKPLYVHSPFSTPSETHAPVEQEKTQESLTTSTGADEPPLPDNPAMRRALNKWSQITGRPDPSFAQSQSPLLDMTESPSIESLPSSHITTPNPSTHVADPKPSIPEVTSKSPTASSSTTNLRTRKPKPKVDADGWRPIPEKEPRKRSNKAKVSGNETAVPASTPGSGPAPARKMSRLELIRIQAEQAREQVRAQLKAEAALANPQAEPTEPADWDKLQGDIEGDMGRIEEVGVVETKSAREEDQSGKKTSVLSKEKDGLWGSLGRWF
ncbi:hypothetical protein BJ138DRAFT_1113304 [Hygrophoropsis aurantiaca]|uniref:Uncharacterized protein n=1 Tax=Hygrophoropsis aurantiaca TaxID=72124 RepID=A0ACB8AD47_9AGAM|nr:hypothetical protein BJ138DRAFT_1113304 [Hygrophoropsis aurantiaca]